MNNFVHTLLSAPLACLYCSAQIVRNALYDSHILPVHTVEVPTVCVGNLAVGGTGKTPLIEWILEMMHRRGYKVAVLSRGYKRKSSGFVLADANSTADDLGDEAMQLHSKFPDVMMAVCKNRIHGIQMLMKADPEIQMVLLDDAFQYRGLEAGYNIVLTTCDNLYMNDHFLPLGTLRDNSWQAHRANAIMVSKCPIEMTPIDRRAIIHQLRLPAYQQLYFSHIAYQPLPAEVEALSDNANVLVVAGIAQPSYLMDYVEKRFPNARLLRFADHHDFSRSDLQKIEKAALRADVVLTTEKDMMRLALKPLSEQFRSKLHVITIKVEIEGADLLETELIRYINSSCK